MTLAAWMKTQKLEPITPEAVQQYSGYRASPLYEADFRLASQYEPPPRSTTKSFKQSAGKGPKAFWESPEVDRFLTEFEAFVRERETAWQKLAERYPYTPKTPPPLEFPEPPPIPSPQAVSPEPRPNPVPVPATSLGVKPAKDGSGIPPQIPFPPFRFLIEAQKKSQKREKRYQETRQALQQASQALQTAEAALKATESERSPYVTRHLKLPEELAERFQRLSEAFSQAKEQHLEAMRQNAAARAPFLEKARVEALQAFCGELNQRVTDSREHCATLPKDQTLPDKEARALLQKLARLSLQHHVLLYGLQQGEPLTDPDESDEVDVLSESIAARLDGLPNPDAEKALARAQAQIRKKVSQITALREQFARLPVSQQTRLVESEITRSRRRQGRTLSAIGNPECRGSSVPRMILAHVQASVGREGLEELLEDLVHGPPSQRPKPRRPSGSAGGS